MSEDKPRKKNSFNQIIVWALMAMLVLGLGGFGVTNFGGQNPPVGQVGDEEISANDYFVALRQEVRALSAGSNTALTRAEADQLSQAIYGQTVSERVLDRLFLTAALDNETSRLGISTGDEEVRERILDIPAFAGLDGEFDRESYRFTLEQNGMTEREFENQLRQDLARNVLQQAVLGGINAPDAMLDALLSYVAETRDFGWTVLTAEDLADPLPEPTEADLQAYYEANPADFTTPETREITYAYLSPELMLDAIDVPEAEIQQAYDARSDEYIRPERRLVERLIFNSQEEAEAAHTRLEAGEISYDTLVEERGFKLSDIDLGDVTRDDLGDAADAVFELEESGDYSAPAPSAFGPAIYRMNGILYEQVTPLDDVRDELKAELSFDRARRVIAEQASEYDDLLAGGATLEELAAETEMELGTISWFAGSDEGIAAYSDFRDAARVVTQDDFPEILELDDGGVIALRLDETVPPTLQPLDDVRDRVIAGWDVQATTDALRAQAEATVTALSEGTDPADLGLTLTEASEMTRTSSISEAPEGLMNTVFDLPEGEAASVAGNGQVAIVQVTTVTPPDSADPAVAEMRAELADSIEQALTRNIFSIFATGLQTEAGASVNEQVLNAVHTQFP